MSDYTLEQVMTALKNADAAGDTEAARRLARIAANMRDGDAKPRQQMMTQVNTGIAEGVGGLVDLLNPFDNRTGSAVDGLQGLMARGGIETTDQPPANAWQAFQRGAGQAAATAVPAGVTAQAMSRAPGMVGQLAGDASAALRTRSALPVEMLAGGASRAAEKGAADAGAPDWLQTTAAIAAPVGLAGAVPVSGAAMRGAGKVAGKMPLVGALKGVPGAVNAAMMPYTKSGAREIARQRMQDLAGGSKRAEELDAMLVGESELGLTPAQRTGDPNMIALEQLAAREDADLSKRLADRAEGSVRSGREALTGMGGDVRIAQNRLEAERRAWAARMTWRADERVQQADDRLGTLAPQRPETENSSEVMRAIGDSLDGALKEEKRLWDAVPKVAQMPTAQARAAALDEISSIPRAQRADVPQVLRDLFEGEDAFGDAETVSELHGLYSELRRIARSAMAGNDQNKNKARIANRVADAILDDLGAVDGSTAIGKAINTARNYSRQVHETFDQGNVGKVLNRTIDGDTRIEPELALSSTIGRGGAAAAVADRQIGDATNDASVPFVSDYIKRQYLNRIIAPDGTFTERSARTFARDNEELLNRYPQLRDEIAGAVRERVDADTFTARMAGRIKALQDQRRSTVAAFLNGSPDEAFRAVLQSRDPAQAAARLAAEASRDGSGQTLAGVKGAFSEFLMRGAFATKQGRITADGDRMLDILRNPDVQKAVQRIFTPAEVRRFNVLAAELSKVQMARRAQPDIGPDLSGATPNKLIDMVARVAAARTGAALGGSSMAGGLQSAQMASSRMRDALGMLVKDRASQLLADAVEDPALFRALLTDVGTPKMQDQAIKRIWPYLVGGASGQE